jgi:hypothetical protein
MSVGVCGTEDYAVARRAGTTTLLVRGTAREYDELVKGLGPGGVEDFAVELHNIGELDFSVAYGWKQYLVRPATSETGKSTFTETGQESHRFGSFPRISTHRHSVNLFLGIFLPHCTTTSGEQDVNELSSTTMIDHQSPDFLYLTHIIDSTRKEGYVTKDFPLWSAYNM